MNAPTPPFNLPYSTPDLALRLGLILAGLVALIAGRFLRMPHRVGMTVTLCARLSRTAWRFMRALTRRGKARPARARRTKTQPADRGDRVRTQVPSLPSGRGWLARELGYEARGFGGQLEALLAEPAMQAVMTELPSVGRILRPLCRMLGVVAPRVPAVAEAVVEVANLRPQPVFWPSTLRAGGFATAVFGPDFAASG